MAPFLVLIGGGTDPIVGGERNNLALYVVAALAVLGSLLTLPALRPVLKRGTFEPFPMRRVRGAISATR